MFVRHRCMGFNHYIVSTPLKQKPKVFNLVSLAEVSCRSSVVRHPAVPVLAFLISASTALQTVPHASDIWPSGVFKLLHMCTCFTLCVFSDIFLLSFL